MTDEQHGVSSLPRAGGPRRAIVFGGAGFIGAHLCRRLVEDGWAVTCADIVQAAQPIRGVDFVHVDVRRPIELSNPGGGSVVFNLAAVHRTPGHEPHEYYETNVFGAQNVAQWCDEHDVRTLVFTSSIAIYGPGEQLKSEVSEPEPNSDYGRSKLMAEGIHRTWRAESPETRALVVARPAVVFGPGEQGNFTRLATALRRRRFLYAGRRDVIKSCGYVSDLVRALLFAVELSEPEITFNYCYPERSSIEAICQAFHDVAGFELPRSIPPALMTSVMRSLKLVNPGDRGTLSAARVAKLTASTNIEPQTLLDRGFVWTTDLPSAIRTWGEQTQGRYV